MSDNRLYGVMRGLPPCAQCGERHTACHDSCPKYKSWKAEAQKIKEAKKAYEEERNKTIEEWNRRCRWGRKTF